MAIAVRILFEITLMVFFGREEVTHHFNRDLIARFKMGMEVFIDFNPIE